MNQLLVTIFSCTGIGHFCSHHGALVRKPHRQNLCFYSQISIPLPEINLEASALQLPFMAGHLARRRVLQLDHSWIFPSR